LDTLSQSELIGLLNRLRETQGMAFVISSHEVNLMPRFLDTPYLVARGGEFVVVGPPREILSRTDLLLEHHMEPPVLAALFDELRRRGIPVETALTVREAADLLEPALRVRRT
jgi:ABC-type glutathione transport system ATPase component